MDFEQYANYLKQSTQDQQAWSAQQAQRQMEFQEAMSSTAHEREMLDLKRAGLNPVLAANNGAAAASGAMGQMDSGLTPALTSLMEKMIDVNMVSAQAALRSAGTGYGLSSSARSVSDDLQGLDMFWMLMERSLGLNPSSTEGRTVREYLNDAFTDSLFGKLLGFGSESNAKTKADNGSSNNVLSLLSKEADMLKKSFSKEGVNDFKKGLSIIGDSIGDWFKKHVSVKNPFKK